MKQLANVLVILAVIPLLVGGLVTVAVLFLGASVVVFSRRLRKALTCSRIPAC